MNTDNKIGVIIADDHEMIRVGLRMLVQSDQELAFLGEAADGQQLVKMVRKYHPDVVLTDLRMPVMEGIDAIKKMHGEGVDRILAYTAMDSPFLVFEALEAGALGCVVKNAPGTEVIEGIKAVYRHHHYYCRSTAAMMATQVFTRRTNAQGNEVKELFNEKERKIIRLICSGKTSRAIAGRLFMSKRTVEGIRSRILEKMRVQSLPELVIYAINHGMYQVNSEEGDAANE